MYFVLQQITVAYVLYNEITTPWTRPYRPIRWL